MESVTEKLRRESTRQKLKLVKEDIFHLLEEEICVYCCAAGTCGGLGDSKVCLPPKE